MNKMTLWRAGIIFLTTAGLCIFFALPAHAPPACSGPNTFTVTNNATLTWGTWQIPASSVTATVSTAGATSGTGTKLYGTSTAANFGIKKNSSSNGCSTVTFSILSPNCNATGCTVGTFRGSWNGGAETNFPITSTTLPSGANTTLLVGATATYGNTVTTGVKTPTYTIGIHYDSLADATYAQTAALAFDAPIVLGSVVNIRFGVVQALTAGTFVINTAGTITPSGGGVWLGGPKNAGSLLITGSSTQTLTISTGTYVAGGIGGGVTLSGATCSYNGGAAAACDAGLTSQAAPTGAGKTLLLGVTATVNGSQTGGTAATPSFVVTVTYT